MRSRAWVALVLAAAAGCGGGHAQALPTGPLTPTMPSPTGTSDDACYLVGLDLQTLTGMPPGDQRTTVIRQLTSDASTGDDQLRQAVATFVRTGSDTAVRAACPGP